MNNTITAAAISMVSTRIVPTAETMSVSKSPEGLSGLDVPMR